MSHELTHFRESFPFGLLLTVFHLLGLERLEKTYTPMGRSLRLFDIQLVFRRLYDVVE